MHSKPGWITKIKTQRIKGRVSVGSVLLFCMAISRQRNVKKMSKFWWREINLTGRNVVTLAWELSECPWFLLWSNYSQPATSLAWLNLTSVSFSSIFLLPRQLFCLQFEASAFYMCRFMRCCPSVDVSAEPSLEVREQYLIMHLFLEWRIRLSTYIGDPPATHTRSSLTNLFQENKLRV